MLLPSRILSLSLAWMSLACAPWARGQSLQPLQHLPNHVQTAIGRTSSGAPVEAWLSKNAISLANDSGGPHIAIVFQSQRLEDLPAKTPDKLRTLLIGSPRRASPNPDAAETSRPQDRPVRDEEKIQRNPRAANRSASPHFTFVAMPGDLATGYPPTGDAYQGVNALRHAIWRWLPLQGVDFLIVIRELPDQKLKVESHCPPGAYAVVTRNFREALSPPSKQDPTSLWAAANSASLGDVGSIPAMQWTVRSFQQEVPGLLRHLRAEAVQPSASTQVCKARLARSPHQILDQLSKHYGDSPQLHYISALACIARLKHERAKDSGRDYLEKLASWSADTEQKPAKNGSEIAGRLVLFEMLRCLPDDHPIRDRLLDQLRATADLALDDQGRLRPEMPFHQEMSDAVFMSGPVLAEASRLLDDPKYTAACMRHVQFMQRLCLRDDGLYRHHPGNEAAWGRGNGFPALGIAWALSEMAPADPAYKPLLSSLLSHLRSLKTHQDADGCWHQIIDRKDSYRELTSTCMILFAMRRATARGWVKDGEFDDCIRRAWHAVRLRISTDNTLVDVCTGTGKQANFNDYYFRKAILGRDNRGAAMAMTAAFEMR